MSELEKMISGKIYDCSDDELMNMRVKAHLLCQQYNQTTELEEDKRKTILKELLPENSEYVYLQGPIYFDYGKFINFGKGVYANFNLTILDTCSVTIKDNVFIGPNVTIATPIHPMCYQDRNYYVNSKGKITDKEYGKPITIESNCWIASNVMICPGVTIGKGTVIGAGSVVVKDIPANVFAAGNPCKVIRKITENDLLKNKTELL